MSQVGLKPFVLPTTEIIRDYTANYRLTILFHKVLKSWTKRFYSNEAWSQLSGYATEKRIRLWVYGLQQRIVDLASFENLLNAELCQYTVHSLNKMEPHVL